MGGDFNSVISANDVSNKKSNLISKTFLKLVRQAKLLNAWWIHNSGVCTHESCKMSIIQESLVTLATCIWFLLPMSV